MSDLFSKFSRHIPRQLSLLGSESHTGDKTLERIESEPKDRNETIMKVTKEFSESLQTQQYGEPVRT